MSIINEALKKVGQTTPPAASAPGAKASPSFFIAESAKKIAPELAKKKQKVNWGPVFVLLVLVLITGPLVAPIFSSPYRSTDSAFLVPSYQETLAASAGNVAAPENRKTQFAIEESPILPAAPSGFKNQVSGGLADRAAFSINGLVYSSPDSYCIINGRVVKVGEKIDGAVLKSVTPEKAVLDYNGTKIDLWINHT